MRNFSFRRFAWIAAVSVLAVQFAAAATPVETEVLAADEAYRVAKLHQDIPALQRILAEQFNETNQNGNSRNKAQTLELWQGFSIRSLTTDSAEVRLTGDTATVMGTQTEDGSEHMLFSRVYQKRPDGWKLLASAQFRNPHPAGGVSSIQEVRAVEEAFRLAKLGRDVPALEPILAEQFTQVNQNGNSRDKAQTLELWKTFSIASLTTDSSDIRISGETAVVLGTQTENGNERMLFTRVYVKRNGSWRLLSSIQFRDPRLPGSTV